MSQHMSYSIAFLLIIAMGFYFMYGNPFSPQKVDLSQYQLVCDQYRAASKGTYKEAEVQMLMNEINYLIPEDVTKLNDPTAKRLKTCSNELGLSLK